MEQPSIGIGRTELAVVPDTTQDRFGDRAGERVAGAINHAVDTMLGAKEKLVGGAQATRELGASALSLVGNFAGKVTDRVVDTLISAGQRLENSAIESGHKKQERASLRAERKEDKVDVRAKIAGLKEISAATKGMSRSEKARFGLDLTELQKDARYNRADSIKLDGINRAAVRADERVSRAYRQGGDTDSISNEYSNEVVALSRSNHEAKMVADARAAEQSIRLNSKLTRAENRETRMQARADAKARRQKRRSAWMDRARTRAGEVVDSAKDRAKEAARLTAKAAKGAGKVALTIMSAPVVIGVASAKEAYDLSKDVVGGIKERAGEVVDSAKDTYHTAAGRRAQQKAEKSSARATEHHKRSSSTAQETLVYTKHSGEWQK